MLADSFVDQDGEGICSPILRCYCQVFWHVLRLNEFDIDTLQEISNEHEIRGSRSNIHCIMLRRVVLSR